MRAALQYKYGPPETIAIEDVAKPDTRNNDILIKVAYSSVNRTDCGFLRAKPFVTRFFSGLIRPRQPILGCEFAGTVEEIGEDVSMHKIGDKVFGFDDVGWGGHGEYKRIHEGKSVAKMPKGSSFQEMAASGEGAHYALSYIFTLRKLGAKRVLVHGGTGAIGSAAVQLMKHEGWYVVATSTTKDKKLVESLGADKVIDWQKTDFTKCGEQFDVVFDAVGKSRFKACKKLLKPKGVYIATELGPYGQNPLLAIISPIYKLLGQKRVLFPLPKNNKQIIEFLADRVADGSFKPVIDREYDLEKITDAYNYVETGQKVGNVLIKVS